MGDGSVFVRASSSHEASLSFDNTALLSIPQNGRYEQGGPGGSIPCGERFTLQYKRFWGDIGQVDSCRFSNEDLIQKEGSQVKYFKAGK